MSQLLESCNFKLRYSCPLCNSKIKDSTFRFYVKQLSSEIEVTQCDNCGLLYKSSTPTKVLFNIIYNAEYVHFKDNSEIISYGSKLSRLGCTKGKLLDYGCGSGDFVKFARKEGYDAFGCDPFLPKHLIGNANYYCIDAKDELIQSLGKFDYITMWAVAEHLDDTYSTFKNLSNLLNSGGKLLFNCPYGNSLISYKSGNQWSMALLVEHLQFHTIDSVLFISKQFDLKIDSIRICGTPYPLGKSDPILGQGIPMQLLESIAPIHYTDSMGFLQKTMHSFLNRIKSLININSERSILAKFVRYAINFSRIGDHIEVVFIKK